MNKIQRDLQRAAWSKNLPATYDDIQSYARKFKKYDNMTMREIDTVVYELEALYKKEGPKNK